MAKRVQHGEDVDINMTPMIDCTFQLIIFFILTSQFASAALAQLELHEPRESQAKKQPEKALPDRVIVNVLSVANKDADKRDPRWSGQAAEYQISGKPIKIGEEYRLRDIFKKAKAKAVKAGFPGEKFLVEIRADKDVEFQYIKPVMDEAGEAEIGNVEITAKRPD